jgi:glycogen operon protein
LNAPDWSHESHSLAATVRLVGYPLWLHIIVNAFWEPLEFEVPLLGKVPDAWRRCIDTFLDSPNDICGWEAAPPLKQSSYRVQPRSVAAFIARSQPESS